MPLTASRSLGAGLRPVYCAIEQMHRSVPRALDVCAGRFTHAGETRDVAGEPAWTDIAIHDDREWWIEWSKFYFGLDLAFAFAQSGDPRFLHTWQRLVRSWIAQVPTGFGPTDAAGRRLQNWIYAWQAFTAAPGASRFAEGFEEELTAAILVDADHLEAHLTPERNHRTLELYALLIVGLALPDHDPGGARVRAAWNELDRNLFEDFRRDGVHREHSTHYHMIALRSLVGARENARRFDLAVSPAFDEHLARALEFGVYVQRTDGTLPALSDSDDGDYREMLRLGAGLVARQDLVAAIDGRSGAGLPVSRAFAAGGYYVQRGAWGAGGPAGRHMVFDCGPLGDGGHGHYDALSIEAWAGRPLVVDPGRFTYAEGRPNWRKWFKGTAAHNTVCVDGLDQTTYRCGKPRGSVASTRLLGHAGAAGLDVVVADVRSANYDARHTRHLCFVNSEYWVVVDTLDADTAHEYDLRFHLSADAHGRTEIHGRTVTGPGLTLLCADEGAIAIEHGWVSSEYGRKQPAPIVSIRQHATSARFVTAVLPNPNSAASGSLSITDDADGVSISIRHATGDCDTLDLERLDGISPAVWTRRDAQGTVTRCTAIESAGVVHVEPPTGSEDTRGASR